MTAGTKAFIWGPIAAAMVRLVGEPFGGWTEVSFHVASVLVLGVASVFLIDHLLLRRPS